MALTTNQQTVQDLFGTHLGRQAGQEGLDYCCLLYTSPSPRDLSTSRMPSSA